MTKRLQILGRYPKGHSDPIRVNDSFRFFIKDCIVIGFDSYIVISVKHELNPAILLDRPLERETNWHESIVFDYPRKLPDDFGFLFPP